MQLRVSNIDKKLFTVIAKEATCHQRVYNISNMRKIVVFLNSNPKLNTSELLPYVKSFFVQNLSSSISKTDAQTFNHIVALLQDYHVLLPKGQHQKLIKAAIKRVNRLLKEESNPVDDQNKYKNAPFTDLLKLLDSFKYMRHMSDDQKAHLCDQVQRILETKAITLKFSFLVKLLDKLSWVMPYEEHSQRLYDFLMQTLDEQIVDSSHIDNRTLGDMVVLLRVININKLIDKSFYTDQEKLQFKSKLKLSITKCLKIKQKPQDIQQFLDMFSYSQQWKWLLCDADFINALAGN